MFFFLKFAYAFSHTQCIRYSVTAPLDFFVQINIIL